MLELVGIILGSSTVTVIITAIINHRSTKIDIDMKGDDFWQKRLESIESDVARIRDFACFVESCKKRVK